MHDSNPTLRRLFRVCPPCQKDCLIVWLRVTQITHSLTFCDVQEAHVLNSVGHAEIARCHALPGHATAASDEAFCEPSAAFLGKGSEDAVQPATLDLAGAGAVEDIRVECDVVLEGGASQRKLSDQNAIREIVSSGAIDGAGDSQVPEPKHARWPCDMGRVLRSVQCAVVQFVACDLSVFPFTQVGWKSSAKPVLRKSSFNVLMQPSSSLSPRFVRYTQPRYSLPTHVCLRWGIFRRYSCENARI